MMITQTVSMYHYHLTASSFNGKISGPVIDL